MNWIGIDRAYSECEIGDSCIKVAINQGELIMVTLGFYVGGVSASLLGATEDSAFAHVVVGHFKSSTFYFNTCGEVMKSGDTGFGKLQNKILHYGWMSCNTQVNGVNLALDKEGRALPLNLVGKFIEIKVDCGTTFASWERVNTVFKVTEMGKDGNKGKVLFEFDGMMKIWAGKMSSMLKSRCAQATYRQGGRERSPTSHQCRCV
ncbi:MAG: hypothetical protein R3F36_04755 [Candidatus Competibacteraceae bacterium]